MLPYLTINQQSASDAVNAQKKSKIKITFDLLKRGESEIQLSDKYKDIVLVLGSTGAGKTTFTQWIAGDNDKLIAKEVAKGTGEFIIEDNNRIGNSTITSKTFFPELVIESKTNTAYYDCPGFSDTRGTSTDIVATYFIKKVLDHAESIKIIFLINHSSLQKGGYRQDFTQLIRHATDLVKDIDKFQNSIAIVATKVNSQYVKQGKILTLVDDNTVIGAIANFLREVKQDFGEKVKLSDISVKEQKFYNNGIKFIDVLLVKEVDYYTKIGIFRKADESGAVSNITLLQEGKNHIERILHEKLNFTEKFDDDFGYTISDGSKNEIHDLVEEINENIWSNVNNIAEEVKRYYHDLVAQIGDRIKSFVSYNTFVGVEQSEAQTFSSKFNNGYNITSDLVKELTNLTNPKELAEKINNSITSLDVNLFKDDILDVANQGKYFNFLQIVSDKALRLSTRPWAELFKKILPYFSELRNNIETDISDTAQKCNEHLNETVKAIHEHYDKKMKLLEIQKLPAELRKECDVMLNIVKKIESAVTTNQLSNTMQAIQESANSLGISIARNNIQIITNQEKYFKFLQIISNKELINGTLTWIPPFKDAVNYLNKSEQWYKFLNGLYSKFVEYEIQKDRIKYNVANLEDWGIPGGKPHGLEINKNNFKQFLNKTAPYNIVEYDNIKNIAVAGLQLEELNHVLNLTLKHKVTVSCVEPYVFIRGYYIILNEAFGDSVVNIPNMDGSCNLTALKYEKLKFINIFALNTLFIDKDLLSSIGNKTLNVIAPKWQIIGSREISVDGVAGDSKSKAKDGAYPGDKGADGQPGGDGGPGGNFFGIGTEFINGAKLTITANGGMGGAGQDGGNGSKGRNGIGHNLEPKEICENIFHLYDFIRNQNIDWEPISCLSGEEYYCFQIFGNPGEKGGHGGYGGRGGKGGKPGSIVLFELNSNSEISKHLRMGKNGKYGKGGFGGLCGSRYDITVRSNNNYPCKIRLETRTKEHYFGCINGRGFYEQDDILDITTTEKPKSATDISDITTTQSPKSATDILDITTTESPKSATDINEIDKAKIINQYKSYLRENLNDRFTKPFLTKFLNSLESNQNVKDVYNTLGLVDELQGLEGQFLQLNKYMDLLPFYQRLLERISEYAKNPKEVGDADEYKKVLSYLYTAALGKIYNLHLHYNLESSLIINIDEYLSSAKKDIDSLKFLQKAQNEKNINTQNKKNTINIINKYKQDYKEAIDKKIAEVKDLISKEITPEIDNIGTETDNEIELLINEVIVLQKPVKEEAQALIEKKQQLEKALVVKSMIAPLKFLGEVLSFLGPVGEVAGSVIGVGSTIAESFILDNKNSEHNIHEQVNIQLPKSVSDQIKITRNQKIVFLKKTLEDISQGINDHPEKLGNISVKIADIEARLNKIDGKRVNFKEIKSLENELKEALQTQEGELRKAQDINDPKAEIALVAINFFKKAVQWSATIFDTYSKYKSNQSQLHTINDAIEQKKNEFQQLKQYEEIIYSIITPILQNMQDDLGDVANKLGNKSSVALDVTKWQVQSTVREMKLQIQQMTDGFKVKDNLARCIEKLEEAMTALITVYDHVQSYQKDQNLANYIADITSAGASNINITDSELSNTVDSLEILIRSNLVLKQYQTAIDGFKQFVFPFAHFYFKGLVLPSYLDLGGANKNNTTLENLVHESTTQIEQIRLRLEKYKGSLTNLDGFTGTAEFNSGYVSSKPFFVWKNEQHKNAISKLLSGQEVVVKADILNSIPDKDAIKLKTIELNFKAKNKTIQPEIDNILKGFEISATHLGNSYYRYNDKIYLITTNSQDFWYSFEKKKHIEEPLSIGDKYSKIKNGDFMLSPYALWKISLYNLTNQYNFTFSDLEIYKDEIDLELVGYGHYVNKKKISRPDLQLMVEKYYKAIDIHDQLELDVVDKGSSTVHLLKDSNSTKNKRAVNLKLEDEILLTIAVDQQYQVTQSSQSNTEHDNSNTESSSWFSWLRLPSFKILPGAEAAIIEGENLVNQKEYVILSLHNITILFINGMRELKDVISSKILKPADNTANSNSLKKISNDYTYHIIRADTSNSLNNLAIGFDGSKNNNIQARTTVDINGNLILGQVVYKMFGRNKLLSNIHYVSPEQEQNIRIKKLASEILPIVNYNSLHVVDGFVDNYNSASQWYQDIYKDDFEEIISKRHQRNEKKYIYDNSSSETILSDSIGIFGDVMHYCNNDTN